jgi:uncharacterized protein YcaQ
VRKYAPLPSASLSVVVRRLRYAIPQWRHEIGAALERARARLAHAVVDGVTWYWPEDEPFVDAEPTDEVRLLAPFDPLVWDRWRFERLWDWAYRFEAYTPAAKRKLGYYALPLLWRDRVIGWANVARRDGRMRIDAGYLAGRAPRDAAFRRAFDVEHARMEAFLSTTDPRAPD